MSFFQRITNWYKGTPSAAPTVVIVPTDTTTQTAVNAATPPQVVLRQHSLEQPVVVPTDTTVAPTPPLDIPATQTQTAAIIPPMLDLEDPIGVSAAIAASNSTATK